MNLCKLFERKNFTAAWQLLKGEPRCALTCAPLAEMLRYRVAALKLGGKVK